MNKKDIVIVTLALVVGALLTYAITKPSEKIGVAPSIVSSVSQNSTATQSDDRVTLVVDSKDIMFRNPKLLANFSALAEQNKQKMDFADISDPTYAFLKDAFKVSGLDYPIFLFDDKTKAFDLTKIPKEDLVQATIDGRSVFAFKNPMLAQLPKLSVSDSAVLTDALDKNAIKVSTNKDKNYELVAIVEPFCSHCAEKFTNAATLDFLKNNNVTVLPVAYLKPNSREAATEMLKYPTLDALKALYSAQTTILEAKSASAAIGVAMKNAKQKIVNTDKSVLSEQATRDTMSKFGILGVPSVFLKKDGRYYPLSQIDDANIQFLLNMEKAPVLTDLNKVVAGVKALDAKIKEDNATKNGQEQVQPLSGAGSTSNPASAPVSK